MTTFKNNAKYAELLMEYLDLAMREDNPLSVPEVLRTMRWRFKGGSLERVSQATRLKPETSADVFPDGDSSMLAEQWPTSEDCIALRRVLYRRARSRKRRALDATLGTWMMLTASYGLDSLGPPIKVYSGMRAIYWAFGQLWDEAPGIPVGDTVQLVKDYTREMTIGATAAAHMHVPTAAQRMEEYWSVLMTTRVPGLVVLLGQVKDVLRQIGSKPLRAMARTVGREERERWEHLVYTPEIKDVELRNLGSEVRCLRLPLGTRMVRVSQEVVLLNVGRTRYALSKGDLERLHQLVMSSTSCLVGVCAQAVMGTEAQRAKAAKAVAVTERNLQRIVDSSRLVELGDEVLVCKAYRRAYTAHLGVLAGPLCAEEAQALRLEAESTAGPGVIAVADFLQDLAGLDAASSLNAGKVFKVCPAPDVSPGGAMLDRIKQIGNANEFDPEMEEMFRTELRDQILRALIRVPKLKLALRDKANKPEWWQSYLKKEFDLVPSTEIDTFLKWEGCLEMPSMSPYDAKNWKDSGIGADTIVESEQYGQPWFRKNMLTRLLFDETCPMPGSQKMTDDHVIKFFVKAEGHKDPARGIFSANLLDRQAQSWMEKAVERVASRHPSFMIGAAVDVRDIKIRQLTALPKVPGWVPLYYSFDISGWSAKMPAEPQRISHTIWSKIYGGHLFDRATKVNEGAHIYVSLEGHFGWFKNTASNLEGFNGKEMTMILVALLSLSVRVWRSTVVEEGHLEEQEAAKVSALLFAYIDDGLSRIDLPRAKARQAFDCYKRCVIGTFSRCGFTVETSKCFPSDRFAIFLNEVYLAGRHLVHGVRAAMAICSEPTERHTSLVERVTSVSTGCRGAVMAGLPAVSGVFLMAYHCLLHLLEWVDEKDPTVLAVWSLAPRTWGGLGLPNMLQMAVSGSGAAFEEGVNTVQKYALHNRTARAYFLNMCKSKLEDRTSASVLTAPLSSRVSSGYMSDSRVASLVRDALWLKMDEGKVSSYAERLLRYGDTGGFKEFADSIIHLGAKEVMQEQMLDNLMDAHPHSIFSAFAKRVEKSMTVADIVGGKAFVKLLRKNREEARDSVMVLKMRLLAPIA